MSHDEYLSLFKYMQKEFKYIHSRLDQMVLKTDFDKYVKSVDAFAKRNETYMQEHLALSHQVDKHSSWIKRVAKAAGFNV